MDDRFARMTDDRFARTTDEQALSFLPCRFSFLVPRPSSFVLRFLGSTLSFFVVSLLPTFLWAQERVLPPEPGLAAEGVSRPIVMMLVLVGLALLPIVAMMTTSFVKLVVVISMVRNALGTQQIPPTTVVTGLALILTVYVMTPVGIDMYKAAEGTIQRGTNQPLLSQTSVNSLIEAIGKAKEPMRTFLNRHAHVQEKKLFFTMAQVMLPSKQANAPPAEAAEPSTTKKSEKEKRTVKREDFMVLIPAFVISELTEAFQIAFIIFLPFVVVDIVVTNILLALGMFMVPPVTMSLPIKLLLFVMVDGWHILTKALLTGYM